MSTINFDGLFNNLSAEIVAIAKESFKDFENEAIADGQQALQNIKLNLQQWATELETGAITREDLEDLLQEDESLTKMMALKQAGLAEIHIDEFRNSVINAIIGGITGLIKV